MFAVSPFFQCSICGVTDPSTPCVSTAFSPRVANGHGSPVRTGGRSLLHRLLVRSRCRFHTEFLELELRRLWHFIITLLSFQLKDETNLQQRLALMLNNISDLPVKNSPDPVTSESPYFHNSEKLRFEFASLSHSLLFAQIADNDEVRISGAIFIFFSQCTDLETCSGETILAVTAMNQRTAQQSPILYDHAMLTNEDSVPLKHGHSSSSLDAARQKSLPNSLWSCYRLSVSTSHGGIIIEGHPELSHPYVVKNELVVLLHHRVQSSFSDVVRTKAAARQFNLNLARAMGYRPNMKKHGLFGISTDYWFRLILKGTLYYPTLCLIPQLVALWILFIFIILLSISGVLLVTGGRRPVTVNTIYVVIA